MLTKAENYVKKQQQQKNPGNIVNILLPFKMTHFYFNILYFKM